MGVTGLWEILEPVARPIALETMGNKRLAIDSSIWLYQFQHSTRDKEGRTLDNAHIMGFVSRIKKLIYYGIKPVFVFDGGAPAIKRAALAKRQKRKREGNEDTREVARKLVAAQVRALAVKEVKERSSKATSKGKGRAENTGDVIADDAVYLSDLGPDDLAPVMRPTPRRGRGEEVDPNYDPHARPTPVRAGPSQSPETTTEPPAKKKKYVHRDEYALPVLDQPMHAKASLSDPRMATEAELRARLEELDDVHIDIHSEQFRALAPEIQYAILDDIRVRSRQPNYRRVETMKQAATAHDFSRLQVLGLTKRNKDTQNVISITEEISKAPSPNKTAQVARIAGERGRAYQLIKQDATKGGGYVLGAPALVEGASGAGTAAEPMRLDTTESDTTDGSDAFEEVQPARRRSPAPLLIRRSPERLRQTQAELIRRFVPEPAPPSLDPYLDIDRVYDGNDDAPLFLDGVDDELLAAAAGDDMLLQDIIAQVSRAENGQRRPASLQPVAGPSRTTAPDAGNDSDDSLEFVDPTTYKPPPPPAASTSDEAEFEEVDTAAVKAVSKLPAVKPVVDDESDGSLEFVDPATYKKQPAAASTSDEAEFDEVETSAVKPVGPASPASSQIDFEEVEAPPTAPAPPIQPRQRAARVPAPAPHRAARPAPQPVEILSSDDDERPPPVTRAPPTRPTKPLPRCASSPKVAKALEPGAGVVSQDFATPQPERRPPSPALPVAQEPTSEPATSPGPTLAEQALTGEAVEPAEEFDKGDLSVSAHEQMTQEVQRADPVAEVRRALQQTDQDESVTPRQSPVELDETKAIGEDSDAFSDWSRSPTPPPKSSSPVKPTPVQPAPTVKTRTPVAPPQQAVAGPSFEPDFNFSDEEKRAADELAKLQQQSRKAQQMATDVTQQMSKEVQEMLRHFGIPYVTAPMEAEAQCAELMARGLVDGIVTNDSDVLLFGGARVYRRVFDGKLEVLCYNMVDIERNLFLDREKLIQLALLLGSDYNEKIVGPVTGMEILAEFPGPTGVQDFAAWWRRVQFGQDVDEDSMSKGRRRLVKQLRSRKLVLEDAFPDPNVRTAYLEPTVETSDEPFTWGTIDIEGLRRFLKDSLGWNQDKVDGQMTPIVKILNDRKAGKANMQGALTEYFDVTAGTGAFKKDVKFGSKKLEHVIKTFRKQKAAAAGEAVSSSEEEAPKKKRKPRKSRSKKKPATPEDSEVDELASTPEPAPRPKRKSRAAAAVVSEPQSEEEAVIPPVMSRSASAQSIGMAMSRSNSGFGMQRSVSAPTSASQLPPPLTAAERAIAHLPPPRMRSGVPQPGATKKSSSSTEKPKTKRKRKLGGRRTAAEKKRHVLASDDSGWEDDAPHKKR